MIIKLNYKFSIAFITLTFVLGEAHEIIHTSVGRIICGCWGLRDFNNWEICESCITPTAIWATIAGPVFTFIVMWIGLIMIKKNKTNESKILGFSLIFANMPFARILNAILGAGDEIMVINKIVYNHTIAWIIGFLGISLITIFPLIEAYKIIENRKKIGWFLLFFFVPTIIYILIILGVMNTLLEKGIMSEYWILGSPKIVSVWTLVVIILLVLNWKYIYKIEKQK